MSRMNAQHTSKLFYGKYLYKIGFISPRIALMRYPDNPLLLSLLESESYKEFVAKVGMSRASWWRADNSVIWKNRFNFFRMHSSRQKLVNNGVDHIIRFDSNTATFFLNDKSMWEHLVKIFQKDLCAIQWPKNTAHEQWLMNNPSGEIVSEYPHGKYKYKFNLRNKALAKNISENFADWIGQYKDMRISKSAQRRIKSGGYQLNGKFLYSTNTENMLLLQMYLGDAVKDITEFKLERDLNG